MPSVWTRLRGALDPVARAYGHYTAYTISDAEYIGHVEGMTTRSSRWFLADEGYTPQYLSAAKRHPATGQLHDLSYRKVPDAHPPEAIGTGIGGYGPPSCQYHVHAFTVEGGVDFYSHYEFRPLTAPLRHYRPTYGETYLRGVTNLDV